VCVCAELILSLGTLPLIDIHTSALGKGKKAQASERKHSHFTYIQKHTCTRDCKKSLHISKRDYTVFESLSSCGLNKLHLLRVNGIKYILDSRS